MKYQEILVAGVHLLLLGIYLPPIPVPMACQLMNHPCLIRIIRSKNRDPRCTATIVEFGTRHLGFEYNPHPDAVQVMNYNTGKMQKKQ